MHPSTPSHEPTLLAALLACVMSCRIRTMFSETVAFLFLLFSRLLSFPSSSGMVLSRLDTGVGEEPGLLEVSEEGRCEVQVVLRHVSHGTVDSSHRMTPKSSSLDEGGYENALGHAASYSKCI